MKFPYLTASVLAVASLFMTSPGMAQTPAPQGGAMSSSAKLDSQDRSFLDDAAQAGQMEIEGSMLALKQARSADVKSFAQRMIEDHGAVARELDALAKSKGYEVPTGPSLMQQAKLKALGLRDEGFDRAYADEIGVSAHEDAVKLFQAASSTAKDPDVRAFAAKTLPNLQKHLEMAKALQQSTPVPAK